MDPPTVRPFLLISPYFAPQTSVGAFRWVKLARHLPRHGFRPVVLSATFPGDARDDGLLAALPPEVEVADAYLDPAVLAAEAAFAALRARVPRRARPGGPLVGLRPFRALTDRCILHAPHAARVAVSLARRAGAQAVVVSAGPFSACPVGLHVKRALGVPLVLDLRDPWSLHESGHGPPSGLAERARRALVPRIERRWLAGADHVILNTRSALEAYRARFPELATKSSFVRNHFDLALYAPASAPEPPRSFVILHLGTLREETSADAIGAALRRLIDRERLAPGDLVLRQIGRTSAYDRDRFERLGLTPYIEMLPPIPQRDVMGELRRAHVLLTVVAPRVVLRIAAKTYDYAASGMPIVSAAASPEVDELLAHRDDNARVSPADVEGLAAALARHLARFRATGALPVPAPPPRELSSEAAAARIAAVLDSVIAASTDAARRACRSPSDR
ncbi:glycosyltransferase [Sorangium sp. So ce362]|uniref:glycosyltransferase n=1 Tax=Sorangium sp. So ce362 TaxID=3133303 RepID=UPI003F637EE9